ncbi:electron transport complex subunit RsxC [Sediminispirochaeta smaragdinae]|jgi:electron transport complex protein RnfC|uniref:Ion-translocating oxidoreductase complex subunit C n=1 Tax=Sediminispirochaeta smaragdinae (strain DSM 11293 / JCM 15392 / SEBR 4228) TaxID=573413 RepID=E1R6L7_SEDSS|nr:electron transport complex subunit RsxC [Sediminispirochaeta smaragdinae]ADK81035.1 electron transport complex, RnfABCDGE type, C subunit [Sediminispirochaeta smaragdinae DSM 11293]
MKGLSTFPKGGVHPPGGKSLASGKAIKNAVLSSMFVVPLSQHLGKPAECIVSVGDEVREGMLIAKASGFISAPVHSPVPGTVKEIRDIYLPNGMKSSAVVIEFAGAFDRLGKEERAGDWTQLSAEALMAKVVENGIVGLGGATFPSHVKFSVPKGKKAEYFVVNGVECEPYLTADHRLMLERADQIIEGIRIISRITNAEKLAIGIEINKPDAIASMKAAAQKAKVKLDVVPLKVKYPQGDEKQLLKAITGREVPSGGLPLDIGAIVANVGTVHAVFEAVVFNKPLIERAVTVTGGAIADPQNLKVRIGTPIKTLIEECGGFTEEPAKIVMGGPMMGFTIYDLDTPVIKGTSGILALTRREVRASTRTFCISCGRCVAACPMGLNPTTLFKLIDHGDYASAMESGLMDCKECGCCGFSCPARIPLVQGMRLGKKMGRKKKSA